MSLGALDGLIERLEDAFDRIAQLETRNASFMLEGPVKERDHEKGVRVQIAEKADGTPVLTDWFQPGDRTGASRYVPDVGEQLRVLFLGGDLAQPLSVPATHTDAKPNPAKDVDETVHHNRDGQRHSVSKGHERNKVERKITTTAGDDGGQETSGKGSGPNLPHELNRQLQSVVARLTQHDHKITALHEITTRLRVLAQPRVPELAAIANLTNGDAQSLDQAVQLVTGKLESYVAKTFQGLVEKLTNGFMGNVQGLVSGFLTGDLGGTLDSVQALAGQHGVDVAAPMAAARAAVSSAAGGSPGAMAAAVGQMATAFAGTPGESAFAGLQARLGGLMASAGAVAAGLSGALDAQGNVVKGLTKSMRLGGYEGEE